MRQILRPGRLSLASLLTFALVAPGFAQAKKEWPQHDLERPMAPVIDPGTASTPEQPGRRRLTLDHRNGVAPARQDRRRAGRRQRLQ
jgi:hypothetical protein